MKLFIKTACMLATAAVALTSFMSGARADDAVLFRTSVSQKSASSLNKSDAYNAVLNGLVSLSDEIDISPYNLSVSEARDLYLSVINEHEELFYVKTAYEIKSDSTLIFPSYEYDKELIPEYVEKFDSAAKEALDSVSDSRLTDVQKLLLIHDYIISHSDYNYTGEEDDILTAEDLTAYGTLVNGTGVFSSYSLAFSYLAKSLGFECEYVYSSEMGHGWNMVMVNGSWYHVDLSKDEPKNSYGHVSHTYFLLSDDQIKSKGYFGWDSEHIADNELSDTFWNGVSTPIIYIDGGMYYITKDSKLTKYDVTTSEISVIKSIAAKWYVISSGNTLVYGGQYSGLCYGNGKLYYSTDSAIYSINPDGTGNVIEVLPSLSNAYIYGIDVVDGKLMYSVKEYPGAEDKNIFDSGIKLAPKTFIKGDVDLNGIIDSSDLLTLQSHLLNISQITGDSIKTADIDDDTFITSQDLLMLSQHLLGIACIS